MTLKRSAGGADKGSHGVRGEQTSRHSMNSRAIDINERRTHGRQDRVHKLFMQAVDTRQQPAGPLLRCTCENVSSRGIGVTLVDPIEPGSRVEIWINVDDEGHADPARGDVLAGAAQQGAGGLLARVDGLHEELVDPVLAPV